MNWDLGKLYTGFDDPAFARDMDAPLRGRGAAKTAIANVREGDEQKNLHAIIERMQSLSKRMGRVSNLIFLTLAADSNCEAALQPRVRYMKSATNSRWFPAISSATSAKTTTSARCARATRC